MTDYTPGNEPNETGELVIEESYDDFQLRRMLEANEDSWFSGSKMRATIQRLMTERDRHRYNKIKARDFRLTHIWEKACEIAYNANYGSEFDDIMDELGTGFSRSREYTVDVEVTLTRIVSVSVTCNYPDDPKSEVTIDLIKKYMERASEPTISDWTCISSELSD